MKSLATLGLFAQMVWSPIHMPRTVTGEAAWYGRECRGKLMANGQRFNESMPTCATWLYPLGTELKVTNLQDNKFCYVTVTDRGPAWRLVFKRNRIIDLSFVAFRSIAHPDLGHIKVRIESTQRYERKLPKPILSPVPQ